jgi:hypothetical protein
MQLSFNQRLSKSEQERIEESKEKLLDDPQKDGWIHCGNVI